MMMILYDFFDIEYGQKEYESKKKLDTMGGKIPLISSKGLSNGVYGFYDITPKYKDVISVARVGTVCSAFYQGWACCIDNNCLILTPKKQLDIREMMYFVLLIRKERYKYMYGRQVTPSRLGNITIPDTIPDWVYTMDIPDYSHISDRFSDEEIPSLDSREWREFKYKDIFHFSKGNGPSMAYVQEHPGDTPYVSASAANNGTSALIDILGSHFDGAITVAINGSIGEAFYQNKRFSATSDVMVLYPRHTNRFSPFVAMFLITLIRKEKYRFNYGRKWNSERMKESTIRLPVDQDNKPDWDFMENYIKTLKYSRRISDV
jgi:restriction endonuclease S subunit